VIIRTVQNARIGRADSSTVNGTRRAAGPGVTTITRLIVERPALWRLAILAFTLVVAACQPGGGGGDPGGGAAPGGDGY
jgi:hypothetical protein